MEDGGDCVDKGSVRRYLAVQGIIAAAISAAYGIYRTRSEMKRLKTRARTDAMTGLVNRDTAIEEITGFLKNEGRSRRHALMVIDLDNFKDVNDSFGHFEGDKVLRTLAGKIRAVFRSGDIVGRLGGDEFIVLMKDAASHGDIRRKALELQNALEYMTSGDDIAVTVTGSIGIADYNGDGKGFDLLYREADEALYRAKNTGKNRYCFYRGDAQDNQGGGAGSALTVTSAGIELKALIDNIDGGIALLEIGQEIRSIYLSSSYVRMMQLSYEGIKQADNRILTFVDPEDMPAVEEMLRAGAATGRPAESVFRCRTRSGAIKWHHMRAVRIAYKYSNDPVMIAIVTDVTNLKETELKYEAQKKQLETVLRVSHVVTFEVDIPNRSLYITEPTLAKYGVDTHVIKNMPDYLIDNGIVHPDSIDECRRMYDEIYAGVEEGSAILRTLTKGGGYLVERYTYFTVKDDTGKPVKAVGVIEGMETDWDKTLRVAQLEKQFRLHSENMLSVLKVRLSGDSFELLNADSAYGAYIGKYKNYSALVDAALEHIEDSADRTYLRKTFSLEGLRRSYEKNKIHLDYEFRVGGDRWRSASAGLYKNELDGEVYAFIRVRDVTRKRALERETGIPLKRGEPSVFYTPETVRRLGDAAINQHRGKSRCSVALLVLTNYDNMLYKYGRILMDKLLLGFIGKTMMKLKPEHLSTYDGRGTITIFIPDAEPATAPAALLERILGFFRDPAFFQFGEEAYMEYKAAVAVSDETTPSFDALYKEAEDALRADE